MFHTHARYTLPCHCRCHLSSGAPVLELVPPSLTRGHSGGFEIPQSWNLNECSAAKRWLLVAVDSRILNWLPRGTKPRWCWSEIRWNHANLMLQFPSLIMALYGSFWPFSGNGDNREVTSSSWGSGGCLPLLVRWLESWTVARLKFGLTRPISFSFPHLNPWVASSLLLICF